MEANYWKLYTLETMAMAYMFLYTALHLI